MGGNKRRKYGARQYINSTPQQLEQAVLAVKSNLMSERQAAEEFKIPKSTINRKRNMKNLLPVGRPCVLDAQEEMNLVEGLIIASKWGFP